MDTEVGGSKSLEKGAHRHNHHHQHHQQCHLHERIALLLAVFAISCLILYQSATPALLLPLYHDPAPRNLPYYPLEKVLKKAAMADGTVIITTLNEAWAAPNSIFDLFLESFQIGNQTHRLLNHLVTVALDQKAYSRCSALHLHCYYLSTGGVDFSGEAYFMTGDYLKMMWRRIDFLHSVLKLGHHFVFTDTDLMWFQDPFPHFYQDADFQIACDHFRGSSYDLKNKPNGGFNYAKSNNQTVNFYKFWYSSRETYPGLHDQDVLNKIKYDPFIKQIGLQIRFLDTVYFGGFCEPSKDFNLVCTMHANCCVGLDNKVHDLKVILDDWRKVMSLSADKRASQQLSWSVPQNCRHSPSHTPDSRKNAQQESSN